MEYWIGEYIRKGRVTMGYTQETFGGFIGRGQPYISKMEKGKLDPGFHEAEVLFRASGQPFPPRREDGAPTSEAQ